MSSDETYLEAFIESLSTVPHEVRRNLDLIKDLDSSLGVGSERLRQLYSEYIKSIEEKMMELEVVVHGDGRTGVRVIGGDAVIVPTTTELLDYVGDVEKEEKIQKLQVECLQKADEKVEIARQAHDMIDATVRRLDADLAAMEKILQSSGDFQTGPVAKPNDLAACQVSPGSEWILAKILHHDPTTGMYKLADEDTEINRESQVVLCGVDKLSRGDVIFAVYPDTTSFYQATVVQAPRKTSTSAGAFVLVNFADDSDEFGITHDKSVPLKHVILPPLGVTIQ